MESRVGQQLGKYRLVRLLGQGSFAEVYLGEHMHLKTAAAVKVLTTLLNEEDAESFLNEAQIIARLVHPHIIRIFDFDVQEVGRPFLVMEYAPNGTLRQPKDMQLPLKTVVAYTKQIADALQYAHDQKLIHRDVKPENMLVGQRHEIVISDFGIAQVAQTTLMESTQKIAGTIAYMSPEQLHGKARFASDQYALGVVVYEWLTGGRPFHGTFSELATQHLFVPPPPLREKVQTLPPAVEEVVMTALAKDFKHRFASVQAFANALEQALSSTQHTSFSTAATSLLFTSHPTSAGIQPSQVQEHPSVPPAPPIPTATNDVADRLIEEDQQSPIASAPSLPAAAPGAALFTDPPVHPLPTQDQKIPHGEPSQQREGNARRSALWPAPLRNPSKAGLDRPVAPITPLPDSVATRSFPFRGKVILLVVLALFVTASGLGIFYLNAAHQTDIVNAHATSVARANASATATVLVANPNPYPPGGGTLALHDSLSDDSGGSGWDRASANCDFIGGAYHVVAIGIRHLEFCVAQSTDFSDFTYEVQMTIVKGDVGGMIFRANSASGAYYLFFVSKDGYYSLYVCAGKTCRQALASRFHASIKRGLNQINRIAVEALGPAITLYVNQQRVASVNDGSFSHGQIGLVASPYANTDDTTEVVYSNARVWTLLR